MTDPRIKELEARVAEQSGLLNDAWESLDAIARERDAARAELLAYGGFVTAAGECKSVSEVLSARLVTVERERDAALARVEELENAEGERAVCCLRMERELSEAVQLLAVWKNRPEAAGRPMGVDAFLAAHDAKVTR